MDVILAYDVDRRQGDVKRALIEAGFHDTYLRDGQLRKMPNTTLWYPETTPLTVRNIFDRVIANLNYNIPLNQRINVTRLVYANVGLLDGIVGE